MLDRIKNFIKEKKNSSKWYWRYFGYILSGLFLVFVGSIFYLKVFLRSKQYAKLLHQRDVKKQEEEIAKVDAEIHSLESDKLAALSEAAKHQEAVQELDEQLVEVRDEADVTRRQLNDIKTWDDVDLFNGRGE